MKTIFDRVLLAQAALETVLGRPIHEEIGQADSAPIGYATDLIADLCHFVTEIGGDAEAVVSDALVVFQTEKASGQTYDRRQGEEPVDDDPEDSGCTSPTGHVWVYTGSNYGGDDERYHGDGCVYCQCCGADGDA